jgi:hypothetical protein
LEKIKTAINRLLDFLDNNILAFSRFYKNIQTQHDKDSQDDRQGHICESISSICAVVGENAGHYRVYYDENYHSNN